MTNPRDNIIRRNGKIATPRVARKEHRCRECPLPISPQECYWEITYAGAGVRSSIYPERTHDGACLNINLEVEKGNGTES